MLHPTFAQIFKTVYTPACDACGEPIPPEDHDQILCPSCRERLARMAQTTISSARHISHHILQE